MNCKPTPSLTSTSSKMAAINNLMAICSAFALLSSKKTMMKQLGAAMVRRTNSRYVVSMITYNGAKLTGVRPSKSSSSSLTSSCGT